MLCQVNSLAADVDSATLATLPVMIAMDSLASASFTSKSSIPLFIIEKYFFAIILFVLFV